MRIKHNSAHVETVRKILIIRPDAIGDVILMLPLIHQLKTQFPNAEIVTLQQAYTAALFHHNSAVSQVLIDWKKAGKAKGFRGFLAYLRFIRSQKFDAVIHSYLEPYYAVLTWLARIPMRVGDGNKLLMRLYLTHSPKLNFRDLATHETEHNITLGKALVSTEHLTEQSIENSFTHLPDPTERQQQFITESDREKADALLRQKGWKGEKLILVHPTTGGGNRAWDPLRYAELIRLIEALPNHKVVLSGSGDKDQQVASQIITHAQVNPISLVNETTLSELMAVIAHCEAVIGTDTGPTHIAAAMGIRVLCISPTKFVKSLRWGPWQTLNRVVGEAQLCDLRCNPYTCREPDCMQAISVQNAFNQLRHLLNMQWPKTADGQIDATQLCRQNKAHWTEKSIRVGLIITPKILRYPEAVERITEQLKNAPNQTHWLLCSSEEVKQHALKIWPRWRTQLVVCAINHPIQLIQLIVKKDITAVMRYDQKSTLYWECIRQLSALWMYVPPAILSLKRTSK